MLLTTNPSVLMAGLVAIASAAVFAIRYVQPKASREYDIIFAVMGLIYSVCLLLEGWRLIPLLFFAQVLVVVFGGFFAVETFRLRNQLVELSRQAPGRSSRGESGFRRTYAPGGRSSASARTVINRQPAGGRIRDARDPERSFENREDRRRRSSAQPRLTDGSSPPRPPRRRRRPPQPDAEVEVLEDQDYPQAYPEDQNYSEREDRYGEDWDRSREERGNGGSYDSRESGAPRRRRPTRPTAEYDEDLRPSREPQSRRRPPRLPEDEEDLSSRPRVIRPEQIEVVDDDDEYYDEEP